MRQPPIIRTKEDVKLKIELLEVCKRFISIHASFDLTMYYILFSP